MNKKIGIIFFIVGFIAFSFFHISAKEISEKEYIKVDSILWNNFEIEQMKLWDLMEENPTNRDSLRKALRTLEEITYKTNVDLAIEYSSVPSGLKRVFMVRNQIEKSKLKDIYNSLSDSMQRSYYGELLKEYIMTQQLKEGDPFEPFECYLPDGNLYDWSDLKDGKILLVFSGLGCMGRDGREIIKQWNNAGWTIIDYQIVNNLQQLQDEAVIYNLGNKNVADFKGDGSPMKIKYDAQAAPTCFLIDENGIIKMISIGLTKELKDAMGVELNL